MTGLLAGGLDDAHRSVSLPRGTVPPVRVIEAVQTVCSTALCKGRATAGSVQSQGRWWVLAPDPAPFCDGCKQERAQREKAA